MSHQIKKWEKPTKSLGLNSPAESSSQSVPPKAGTSKVKQEIEVIREKIVQLVQKSPEKAVLILAEWIRKK
jgi:hypothetical protein